jgi:hypothetical protein
MQQELLIGIITLSIISVVGLVGLVYFIVWKKQQNQLWEVLQQILVVVSGSKEGGGGAGAGSNKEILETFRDALLKMEKKIGDSRFGGGGESANATKMAKMLEGIRDYLADGKAHQVRLQEGYDYAVLKNFCKQIIRCIHRAEAGEKSQAAETLEGVRIDLLDLLERSGIERFEPARGENYSKLRKVARVLPQKELTTNDAMVGTVAEVVAPGYLYTYNDDKQRLILPAEVKIYEKTKE